MGERANFRRERSKFVVIAIELLEVHQPGDGCGERGEFLVREAQVIYLRRIFEGFFERGVGFFLLRAQRSERKQQNSDGKNSLQARIILCPSARATSG